MAVAGDRRRRPEVEFRRGTLVILDPELERQVRRWLRHVNKDRYGWTKITFRTQRPGR